VLANGGSGCGDLTSRNTDSGFVIDCTQRNDGFDTSGSDEVRFRTVRCQSVGRNHTAAAVAGGRNLDDGNRSRIHLDDALKRGDAHVSSFNCISCRHAGCRARFPRRGM